MRIPINHRRGSVLVTMLIITGLVTVVVAALVVVVERQNYFTARSTTWCSEIPIAEAGIEEAMAHLNSQSIYSMTNGWMSNNAWKASGSNYVKWRYFTNGAAKLADGYFYTSISTTWPPSILSIGYGRIPLQTNYTQRAVLAMTKANPPSYGIVAKQTISLNGSGSDWPYFDSYDSSKGPYGPLNKHDMCGVATCSTARPAIDTGSGEIWGFAATGPGGAVAGNVGDAIWNLSGTNPGIESGHVRDDFNLAIPDVSPPTSANWTPIPIGWVLATKDYLIPGDLSQGFQVAGNARLWVQGNVSISGVDAITILPGGSLQLFVGPTNGSTTVSATFGGGGVVNATLAPANCRIFGLPKCNSMKFSGSADMHAVIYAPQADVKISGNPNVYGSFTANAFNCSGKSGIHYDERLGLDNGPAFTIVSWEEL